MINNQARTQDIAKDQSSNVAKGIKYEIFVKSKLESDGYTILQHRSGKGDHGADIIATKDNEKIVIQCKYQYKGTIPYRVVQEAYAAKELFNANKAMIYANVAFSTQCQMSANKLSIGLEILEHNLS